MPPLVVMPLLFSPLIYITGRWKIPAARTLTLLALGGIWVLYTFVARDFASTTDNITYTQGLVTFNFDGLSLLITSVTLFLSTLIVIYSGPDIRGQQGEEKYYAMLLLLVASVIGLVCAGDLFNLWLWFEMTAISSYLLVAFYRERGDALAACAKYLIQTATGSIVVLLAIVLIFAQTGTLSMSQLHLLPSPFTVVAGALFILGFGVKFALVPTHTWLPDAYAQAPTGISALLSGVITITGLAALLRVLALLSTLTFGWGEIIIGFGTLNIVIGNLIALRQVEVKRIFAYSSISHIGFVLVAIGIGLSAHQMTGFYSGILHLFNHAIMKALAFLAVGTVSYTRFGSAHALRVDDLKGLAEHDPITTFALVISCLSLAGVAPLAGFMSKLQIFASGLEANLTSLMVFLALNSVFSLAYYAPIINALFQRSTQPIVCKTPTAMLIPIIALTSGTIVFGFAPGLLNSLVTSGSQALMHLFGG